MLIVQREKSSVEAARKELEDIQSKLLAEAKEEKGSLTKALDEKKIQVETLCKERESN